MELKGQTSNGYILSYVICFLFLIVILSRDMFIPANIRPKQKPVDEFSLSSIFSVLDEMLEVFCHHIEITNLTLISFN